MKSYAQASTLALCALTAGASCTDFDLVHASARASEVCLTGMSVDIPAGESESVRESHVLEDPAAELPPSVDAEAHLVGVGVQATEGVNDFGFVDEVRVRASTSDMPAVDIAQIGEEESELLAESDRWFVSSDEELDLIDYLLAPELELEVLFSGQMPERDWQIEVDLCVSGAAAYSAGV